MTTSIDQSFALLLAYRIAVVAVAMMLNGCMSSVPVVTEDGQIKGGHPKLAAALERLQTELASLDPKALPESVQATITIAPSFHSFIYKGVLPSHEGQISVPFSIVASAETIDQALICSIALSRKGAGLDSHPRVCVYQWQDKKWNPINAQIFTIADFKEP